MVRVINLSVLLAKSQVIPSQTILVQCGILGLSSQSYAFSSSHVQMWELDHKEGWELKKWCFHIVVLEKALESPLDCKEIKPVNPKGNQPWIFIGRTNAEAPILWSPDEKLTHWKRSWSWERLRAGREGGDRGWDGSMASWLNGHEFEQTTGDGKGQGSLSCWSLRGHKELDTT